MPAPVAPPTVSVIIVSYKRRDALRKVLAAYGDLKTPPLDIIVCENASSEGAAEMIRAEFPKVQIIEPGANAGFARAANLAARGAKGDVLVLSPDDVIPTPDYVDALVRALVRDHGQAVSGTVLEWPNVARINTAGASISPILRLRVERSKITPPHEGVVRKIIAGSMAVWRDVFLSLGGFEELFGSGFEDVDLSMRIHRAGGTLLFAGDAVAHHLTHSTEVSYVREYLDRKNIVIFYARHSRSPLLLAAFLLYVVAWATPRDLIRTWRERDDHLRRCVLEAFSWWTRRPRELLKARRRAQADIIRLRGMLSDSPERHARATRSRSQQRP